MRGTIIRLIPNKGFGFIRGDEDGISRFAHARAFTALDFDRAREGQAVEFTPVVDPEGKAGGQRAMDIVLLPAGYAV